MNRAILTLLVPILAASAAAQGLDGSVTRSRLAAIQAQAASLVKSVATKASDGHTIYAKAGGRLEVYLPGQPGTGYGWHIVENDSKILGPVGGPTLGEIDVKRGLDRAEMEIFVFAVKARGTVRLRLDYKRPGEKVPPADTFGVTVIVIP